jgi:hypothetical protein
VHDRLRWVACEKDTVSGLVADCGGNAANATVATSGAASPPSASRATGLGMSLEADRCAGGKAGFGGSLKMFL